MTKTRIHNIYNLKYGQCSQQYDNGIFITNMYGCHYEQHNGNKDKKIRTIKEIINKNYRNKIINNKNKIRTIKIRANSDYKDNKNKK